MNLFGYEISIRRKLNPTSLSTPQGGQGWFPIVRESFTGAWQSGITTNVVDVLSDPTVFACVTLIAGDLAKMRCELVRDAGNDVWVPFDSPAFSPFLRAPNHYQTPYQFFTSWMISKLTGGNAFILKMRDQRGVVIAGYVLDWQRVKPLVAEDGSIYYELQQNLLATQSQANVVVPAREIFHDLMNPMFHTLVGLSPLYAAGIPAVLSTKILVNSAHFFGNGSTPGGVITHPGALPLDKAKELKALWETNYGGVNAGRVAVLSEGMKFEPVFQPADKSQTIEQASAASEAIAKAFHVPWFMVGGPMPNYANIQAQTVAYFTQCIQHHSVAMEQVLDVGLGLAPDKVNGERLGTQFNVSDLLWLDSATMMSIIKEGIGASVLSPNEGRARINLLPVDGGESPLAQQQYWPLEVLAEREAPAAPQAQLPAAQSQPPQEDTPEDMPAEDMTAMFAVGMRTRGAVQLEKRLAA